MAGKRRGSKDSGNSLGNALTGFILKLLFAVVVIVMVLTFTQCTVKKPQSPSWDTHLSVPLISRVYTMSELINRMNEPGVGFDIDSNVVFSISRDLDTFRLDQQDLSFTGFSYDTTATLGAVTITPPTLAPIVVPVASIGPLAGLSGDIPAIPFSVSNDLPPISSLSSATVASGKVYVVVANNLGIDLSSVSVTLYDVRNAVVIGTQSFFIGLLNGDVDSLMFNLNGQTISDQLRATVDATTSAGTILATGTQEISTGVSFSNPFTVSAATTQVPSLSRSVSQQMALGESTPVYDATLASGTLSLSITNNTPLAATINIILPDLSLGGLPLDFSQNVPANSTVTPTVNLAGYILTPSDLIVPQSIQCTVLVATTGTGSGQVTVDQNQGFHVTAALSGLTVQSVTGVIAPTTVDVTPADQSITVPQGFDSVQLSQATLSLEIINAVDLPGSLSIQIQGNNGKTLNLSGTIAAGSVGSPILTVMTDTTVADFLWPLPSSLSIAGSATFGDSTTTGTLTSADFVHARVRIDAPLDLILHQSTVRPGASKQSLDSNALQNIADHINAAQLIYTLDNHLPIGARFSLYLNGDSATAYTSPDVLIDNLFVNAGTVGGNGTVTAATSTGEQTVLLDSLDIQVLRNPALWIASQIILDSTGGQSVRLTAQDYVGVTGRIEIDYRFDGNF
ncbi:MAG: hypothetical protein HY851_12015 [candidate division Zixibacteria bacterium]|nr:hypothetical protein [candidate division Zixibacteria bacterium]